MNLGGGAAQNSGPYSVSPAPGVDAGESGIKTRLDRPAASTLVAAVFADFERCLEEGERNGHAAGLVDKKRIERFFSKVDFEAPNSCWEWVGARSWQGYGYANYSPIRQGVAHRIAWELLRGPIPAGLVIDHRCQNKPCVNPDHLELVTRTENTRRGTAWREAGRTNAAKTQCPSGHAYDEANTLVLKGGRRDCRTCNNAHVRKTKRSKTHCPAGHEFTPENTHLDRGVHRRCLTCRRRRDVERRAYRVALLASATPVTPAPKMSRRRNLAPRLERGGAA